MQLQDLPSVLPLYAAEGIILLPRAQLPLLLGDIEAKALVDDAIQEKHRLIGVVQQNQAGEHFLKGCVGRIVSFQEGTQLFITLEGICRFNIEEVTQVGLLKKARVNYVGYEGDLKTINVDPFVNRGRLLNLLKKYLEEREIFANWEEIDHASDDLIISSLTMACPFEPLEKQALLETTTLAQRCDIMIALMEMSSSFSKGQEPVIH